MGGGAGRRAPCTLGCSTAAAALRSGSPTGGTPGSGTPSNARRASRRPCRSAPARARPCPQRPPTAAKQRAQPRACWPCCPGRQLRA
eukprot:2404205-Lingulodinium_polyedra.AAC.1